MGLSCVQTEEAVSEHRSLLLLLLLLQRRGCIYSRRESDYCRINSPSRELRETRCGEAEAEEDHGSSESGVKNTALDGSALLTTKQRCTQKPRRDGSISYSTLQNQRPFAKKEYIHIKGQTGRQRASAHETSVRTNSPVNSILHLTEDVTTK